MGASPSYHPFLIEFSIVHPYWGSPMETFPSLDDLRTCAGAGSRCSCCRGSTTLLQCITNDGTDVINVTN